MSFTAVVSVVSTAFHHVMLRTCWHNVCAMCYMTKTVNSCNHFCPTYDLLMTHTWFFTHTHTQPTHTCIVETIQHWCFSKVQPPKGDGGEQGALWVAGSLQALQRSGLRAAGHHRLQSIVQDVHDPQRALFEWRTGTGHLASLPIPVSVPLPRTHPGGVLSSHIGDLRALPCFHGENLEWEFLVYLLPTPVTFHLSFPLNPLSCLLPPSCPPDAHLLRTCSRWRRARLSLSPRISASLTHIICRLSRTKKSASPKLDPTRSRRERRRCGEREESGGETKMHP